MAGDLEVPIAKTESQILTSSSSSPNFDGAEQREQGQGTMWRHSHTGGDGDNKEHI